MRQFLFLLLFLGLGGSAFAQSVLSGKVYENKSNIALQGIRVDNLNSRYTAVTGPDGSFSISADIGDLLTFSNSNYKTDTLFVVSLKPIQILLIPLVNQLQEVKITNQQITKNSGFNTQQEKGLFGSNKVLYQTDDSGRVIGGLKMNIPDGGETKRQHTEKVDRQEAMKAKIEKVFSPENLKKYLPITGQEMANFIILYMPDIDTYFAPDFNLVAYLNEKYKEFNEIPADQRQSKSLTQLTPAKN